MKKILNSCRRGRSWTMASVAAAALMAVPAQAQDNAPQETEQPEEDATAQESSESSDEGNVIIVTAQKREERLLDVPISITAITEERFEQLGATDFKDLSEVVPNLLLHETASGTTARIITIRGIGVFPRNVGYDQGIGFYLDGVYLGRNAAYNLDLTGIERVEVLRGPQGTLYGRNTIAGTINYITTKPNAEFGGKGYLRYGDYNGEIRGSGSINTPLAENLFLRTSGSIWEVDGHIKNVTTGNEVDHQSGFAGRLQLRWVPTDRLTVDLSADTLYEKNGLPSLQPAPGTDFFMGEYVAVRDLDGFERRRLHGLSSTIQYEFGGNHTLSSITAWRNQKLFYAEDGDLTPIPEFIVHSLDDHVNEEEFTQELRVNSPTGGRFEYVGGIYYLHSKADSLVSFIYGPFISSLPGPDRTTAAIDTNSWAMFGQLDFHATDNVILFAGGRINWDDKHLVYQQDLNSDFCCEIGVPTPFETDFSDSQFTWTAGGRFYPRDNVNIYGVVSRGYKSGGFNADLLESADDIVFGPEFVTSYEIGLKANLLRNNLILNLAAFTLDYTDLQTAAINPVTTSVFIANAGRVKSSGFEAEFIAQPTDRLQFICGLGYADAEYKEFAHPFSGDLSGKTLPHAPRWSWNLTSQYNHPLGNGELVFIGTANYRSSIFSRPENTTVLPGRTLIGGRVGYEAPDDRWSIYLYGENLTDERYLTTDVFIIFPTVSYGPPRNLGVEARFRF